MGMVNRIEFKKAINLCNEYLEIENIAHWNENKEEFLLYVQYHDHEHEAYLRNVLAL